MTTRGDQTIGIPKPAWADDCRCACRAADPNLFAPERHNAKADKLGKAICRGCPMRTECLAWALRTADEHGPIVGILGGLNPTERRKPLKVAAAFREAAGYGAVTT